MAEDQKPMDENMQDENKPDSSMPEDNAVAENVSDENELGSSMPDDNAAAGSVSDESATDADIDTDADFDGHADIDADVDFDTEIDVDAIVVDAIEVDEEELEDADSSASTSAAADASAAAATGADTSAAAPAPAPAGSSTASATPEYGSLDRELLSPPEVDPYAHSQVTSSDDVSGHAKYEYNIYSAASREESDPHGHAVAGADSIDSDSVNAADTAETASAVDNADATHAADVDDATDVTASDTEDSVPLDEAAPSSTASAADVTTAGGSTMARRVRKARRARRGQKAVARRRNIVGAVTHTFGALAALGVLAGTTWALGWVQIPEFQAVADTMEIAPAPGEQQRVCPGSLQQLGLVDEADQSAPVGEAEVTIASSIDDYKTTDFGEAGTDPVNVIAPGEVDGETTMLSASQSVSVATSDTTGLSVTNCTQPAATQWVAGGATTLGHTLVLDVINPGQVDARVNFEVYGIDGVVVPGLQEVVIEPESRETLSLAGIAPNATAFAVKVTSSGAPVSAFLHETITDTLTPKGSDLVGSTALPSTLQSLPGIFVYGRPDSDVTTFAEIGTTLRILNPNDETATGSLTAYDVHGEPVYSEEIELASYRVVELPFAEVPEGEYTITLESDRPVLMAGRVSPLDGNEFAWVPSSASLVGNEFVPVAEGPAPRLSVFNPTEDAREIEVNGQTVTVEPFATYQTNLSGGSSVALDGVAGLSAALHYSAAGQLASAPVRPGNADAEPIRIVK